MPPTRSTDESSDRAALRWLTRILAALAHQSKSGTVIVSRASLDAVSDTIERQALFEDRDKHGNLVLRFGSKHSAVYPVESEACDRNPTITKDVLRHPNSPVASINSPSSVSAESTPQVVPPKTDAAVARLEAQLAKHQLANRIVADQLRRERQQRQSLEGMLEQFETQERVREAQTAEASNRKGNAS